MTKPLLECKELVFRFIESLTGFFEFVDKEFVKAPEVERFLSTFKSLDTGTELFPLITLTVFSPFGSELTRLVKCLTPLSTQ